MKKAIIIVLIPIIIIGGYIYFRQNNSDKISKKDADTIRTLLNLNPEDFSTQSKIRDELAINADTSTVRAIAEAYHGIEPKIVEVGGGQKTDENDWKRSVLMGAILRVRSPLAVRGLEEIVLNDADFSLQTQAIIALAAIGTKDAVQTIVSAIKKSKSSALTRVLVESLGMVNNIESLGELVSLLNISIDENIRYGVAKALGNIPDNVSMSALKSAQQKETSTLVKNQIEISLKKLNASTK
jgi:HEAT repeat protein